MAGTPKIVRVLVLAQALANTKRGISIRDFAENHDWPWRSVYRDLQALERAGFPIVRANGRHRFVDGWRPFGAGDADSEELLGLFVARQLAAAIGATSLGRGLDRLWARLSGRGSQAGLLPAAESPLTVRPPGAVDYGPHREAIRLLERGVRERLAVSCRYRALSTGDITERVVEPGELYYDPALESLYLIGWCRLRDDVRVFAVHRLCDVALTEERFAARAETRSAAALRGAFRLWRRSHVENIVLHFDAAVAEEIKERRWHRSQKLKNTDAGGVVLSMEVAAPAELERWILGFGGAVQVVEPTALRDRVRSQGLAIAEAGGSSTLAVKTRRGVRAVSPPDNRRAQDVRARGKVGARKAAE